MNPIKECVKTHALRNKARNGPALTKCNIIKRERRILSRSSYVYIYTYIHNSCAMGLARYCVCCAHIYKTNIQFSVDFQMK